VAHCPNRGGGFAVVVLGLYCSARAHQYISRFDSGSPPPCHPRTCCAVHHCTMLVARAPRPKQNCDDAVGFGQGPRAPQATTHNRNSATAAHEQALSLPILNGCPRPDLADWLIQVRNKWPDVRKHAPRLKCCDVSWSCGGLGVGRGGCCRHMIA
jgi:hypothetical protein